MSNHEYNHELGDIISACGINGEQLHQFRKKIAKLVTRDRALSKFPTTISRDIEVVEEFITQHPTLIRMYIALSIPIISSIIATSISTEEMMKDKANILGISITELEERILSDLPEHEKAEVKEMIEQIVQKIENGE